MVARILHTSYIIDFLDVDFNSDEISDILKKETDKKLKQCSIDSLENWEIQFKAIYGKGSVIRIYKKMPSYAKDKQKPITIHIPIPENTKVPWGVHPDQYIEVGKNANEEKNVSYLNVHFEQYSSRKDYIIQCLRRAISLCLEEGLTINGRKVSNR